MWQGTRSWSRSTRLRPSIADMRAYYNEIDRYCCDWLQNLMDAGHITPGKIDDRDIREVQPEHLAGFERVHFFSGIGAWDHALDLAGWRDRPVWTASCPCPPFSVAGKQLLCPACESPCLVWCPRRTGFAICGDCEHAWLADERHLWPEVWRLAARARPRRIYGEQVDSPGATVWYDAVQASLGILGYATRAEGLPASSLGAPHIRQRLWWVADADGRDASAERLQRGGQYRQQPEDGGAGRVADADGGERRRLTSGEGREHDRTATGRVEGYRQSKRGGQDGGLVDPLVKGLERHAGDGDRGHESGRIEADTHGSTAPASPWSEIEWLPCSDGKARPAQPGIFPLVTRTPGRVGQLRAYGNAIVPAVAAAFIQASTDAMKE